VFESLITDQHRYVDQSSLNNGLPLQIYMRNVNMLNLRQNPCCGNESRERRGRERVALAFRERERERERETEGKNTLEKFTERYHKWQRQFSGKKLLHHNFNPKKNWKESPEGAESCHLEKWQWKRSLTSLHTHTHSLMHI